MKKKYYSLTKNTKEEVADLIIFGDITSWPWQESDVSSYNLSKKLAELKGVNTINVHINSMGGEVAEGLAIYNALKNSKAKINTYVDGFACSIASVIFMAGEKRFMPESSMLMIHNAWMWAQGNPAALKKAATDLEKINQTSIKAYLNRINISEEKLQILLDDETFISPEEALKMGFATEIIKDSENKEISQNAKKTVFNKIFQIETEEVEEEPLKEGELMKTFECSECGYIVEMEELPEYYVCPECGADKDSFTEINNEDETINEENDDSELETEDDETETSNDEEIEETETSNDEEKKEKYAQEKATKQMVAFLNAIIEEE